MKNILSILLSLLLFGCGCSNESSNTKSNNLKQTELTNKAILNHLFLEGMYSDSYFPNHLVDEVKSVLVELCFQIEMIKPKDLKSLYSLTHESTSKINQLQNRFYQNGSEIETAAREVIAEDFEIIANSYGFKNADIEELIATREW